MPGRERDITLDVTIRARTAEADKAAAALKKVDERAAHAGKSMEGMTGDAKILNAEIAKSEQTVKDLDKVLLEFGNDKSVRQRLRSERSWLADLKRIEKDLASGAGAVVTNDFGEQLSSAFSGAAGLRMQPVVIGALVEAAAIAAAPVGAMLAGGIAGAAGTAAMAAGILSAAKSPEVQSAAQSFGAAVSAEFFGGGEAFVQPVLDSLDILERGFADMHLGDALAKAAPTVEIIAQGLADAGKNFMPGFNQFLDRIGPLADAAGAGIADMGDALGDFLDDVSSSKGTVEGLTMLFTLVNGTVRLLGQGLELAGDGVHRFNREAGKVTGVLEDVFSAVGLRDPAMIAAHLNDQFERMTGTGQNLHGTFSRLGKDAVDPFAGYLLHASAEMEKLHEETLSSAQAISEFWAQVNRADDAAVSWERALDNIGESVKENGRSLDIHTEAGRRNHEAVVKAIVAAQEQYEVNIAAGMSAEQAGKQFAEEVTHLEDVAAKAGLARKELEALAKNYVVNVAVQGAFQFLADALKQAFGGGGGGGPAYTGRGEFRAAGGPVMAGQPYIVGERRPELFVPSTNGRILPSTSLAASGGGGTIRIIVQDTSGRTLRNQLIDDALMRGVSETTIRAVYP